MIEKTIIGESNYKILQAIKKEQVKTIIEIAAKESGKNWMSDFLHTYFLENNPLANNIGLRNTEIEAARVLSDSFFTHLSAYKTKGWKTLYEYEMTNTVIHRKKYQGIKSKKKNQQIRFLSLKNKNSYSGIKFPNGGYCAFVHIDEVIDPDLDKKSFKHVVDDWNSTEKILKDSVNRSAVLAEEVHGVKFPLPLYYYTMNGWSANHPISEQMEKYLPEKKWISFLFPSWFNYDEIYSVEKKNPTNKPIEWLVEFLNAEFNQSLINEIFYDEDKTLQEKCELYVFNIPVIKKENIVIPFDNPFSIEKSGFDELILNDANIKNLYKESSVYGFFVAHFKKHSLNAVLVKVDEMGSNVKTLYVRRSKFSNPAIDKNFHKAQEMYAETLNGIASCDSLIMAANLGFIKVPGIQGDKAYAINQNIKNINWSNWIEENEEHFPIATYIGVDIDFNRRIVLTPELLFAKIKNNKFHNYKLIIAPQLEIKTDKSSSKDDNGLMDKTIEGLEWIKKNYIDVLPWEEGDIDIQPNCRVVSDRHKYFINSINNHYQEQDIVVFNEVVVVPSKQGYHIDGDGFGIPMREDMLSCGINDKVILIDESNRELLYTIKNVPKNTKGQREEKGVWERNMDTINSMEYPLFFLKIILFNEIGSWTGKEREQK